MYRKVVASHLFCGKGAHVSHTSIIHAISTSAAVFSAASNDPKSSALSGMGASNVAPVNVYGVCSILGSSDAYKVARGLKKTNYSEIPIEKYNYHVVRRARRGQVQRGSSCAHSNLLMGATCSHTPPGYLLLIRDCDNREDPTPRFCGIQTMSQAHHMWLGL